MIKLKDLLNETLKAINEAIDMPPPAHVQSTNTIDKSFIEYIKKAENGNKFKLINGKWYPFKDPNGKFYVIAYGHKIEDRDLTRYQKGIPESEGDRLLVSDLEIAKKKAYSDVKSMFGVNIPLDQRQEQMLMDMTFNLGSLKSFPKFTKAVLNKDWETVKKEYERKWKTPEGKVKSLTARNKAFYDRFLK